MNPKVAIIVINEASIEPHDRDVVFGELQEPDRFISAIRTLTPNASEQPTEEEVQPQAFILPKASNGKGCPACN
jgi:hypothetical protein